MRRTLPLHWLCLGLAFCVPAFSEETVVNMPQLMQLNRASQQELRDIQSAPRPSDEALSPSRPWRSGSRSRSLDRQQQVEQGTLQEGQRREVLMENQRAKTVPSTGFPRRLEAINQQRQYRLQQQNQLNRFRAQQGVRRR